MTSLVVNPENLLEFFDVAVAAKKLNYRQQKVVEWFALGFSPTEIGMCWCNLYHKNRPCHSLQGEPQVKHYDELGKSLIKSTCEDIARKLNGKRDKRPKRLVPQGAS